jgi:putative ABC transport system permease protein
MRVGDLVYETALAFDANRGRSLLTVLGIVIGIAAVIAMMALIGGIKMNMVSQMGFDQAQRVNISCWYGSGLKMKDIEAMERDLSEDYEFVTPLCYGSAEVNSETKKIENGQIYGEEPEFFSVQGFKVKSGHFLTEGECSSAAQVAIINEAGVKVLFGRDDFDAVGQTLRIKGSAYTIVGVAEGTGQQAGSDFVDVYIPFDTCGRRVNGSSGVDQAYGFAWEGLDMDTVKAHTEDWLAERFKISDDDREGSIWVMTMESIIKELDSMLMSFQVLMTSVASISLVVGGIGIMNMMLTNVTERIREIGLRKALGARRRDITRQFLLESVCLTLAGGAIGIVLGFVGAYGLASLAGGMLDMTGGEGTVTPYLDAGSVLLVAGICVGIGLVFGYYPARRAARLDPVESLHFQ